MRILIDTSIWSLALRRQPHHLSRAEQKLFGEWKRLVVNGDGFLTGPIRQELLSGIRHEHAFELVQNRLDFFDCIDITIHDYDQAARFHNALRSEGIHAAAIDVLLCAVAYRRNAAVFTSDRDFVRFAMHIPIALHRAE